MNDSDLALAWILAQCKTDDELNEQILTHAYILQYLVCRLAGEVNQSEAGIRALYKAWADMTVEQFKEPWPFPRKPH